MKKIWDKFKGRILAALAVAVMGLGLMAAGVTPDWGKLLDDALQGEVTDTAQVIEDAAKVK